MRALATVIAGFLAAAAFSQVAFDTRRFDVDATIDRDRSVTITERISVHFREPRRGIVRTLPHLMHRNAASRRVEYEFESYQQDGRPVPAQEVKDGTQWTIRIGQPDLRVSGDVTYTFRYRVRGGLTNIEGKDKWGPRAEFFWNLIPKDWPTSVAASKITLTYPEPASDLFGVRALFGPGGSRAGVELFWGQTVIGRTDLLEAQFASRTTLTLEAKRPLDQGFGITAILALPQGTVEDVNDAQIERTAPATPAQSFGEGKLFKGGPWGLLPILPGLLLLIRRWVTKPKSPGPLVVRFDPPTGADPMRAGVLFDDKFQPRDVLAGIVSLAQQGAGQLRVQEGHIGLHLNGTEPVTLSDPERSLLRELQTYGPEVTADALRGSFGMKFNALDSLIRNQLVLDGWRKGGSVHAGTGLAIAATLGLAVASCFLGGFWVCPAVVVGFILLLVGTRLTTPWTQLGLIKKWELSGLREFIVRAHKDPLEFAARYHPDAAMYERLLPYALGFGLVKEWSKAFDGIDMPQPSWMDSGADSMIWYWWFSDGFNDVDRDWSSGVAGVDAHSWISGGSGFGGDFSSGGGFDGGGGFDSGGGVGDGGGGGGGGDW